MGRKDKIMSSGPGPSTVYSMPFFTLVVVCVLSSCITGAQCCMPMMNMMMPMMEQAQNAMAFQASSSMFKTFFENFGQPLFKLHVGGATSLVSHVLYLTSPFPFAPQNWFEIVIQLANFVVSITVLLVNIVEVISRIVISFADINYWSKLGGFLRAIYGVRLFLSPAVATTPSPLALEADQEVALLVRELNTGKGESRGYEGAAAQDCVRELMCGLYASRATTHLWQTFWSMVPSYEEQTGEPPSLPQLCDEQAQEFTSCYAFADDVMQTWQTRMEDYRNTYFNESITPWTWAMFR